MRRQTTCGSCASSRATRPARARAHGCETRPADWVPAALSYHGGWVAPNIYYLGTAGSVLVNGLRISGASGIYKSHDYHKGETPPFTWHSPREPTNVELG